MEDLEGAKELEKSILKVFDKYHNRTNESSEAEALVLLSQLPNPAEARNDDKDQFTLLHHACYNGWYVVAKVLIERYNCDPYCRNAAGSIPLHMACSSGNLDLVKYLILDKECDPNDTNNKGQVPLHIAALDGNLVLTKFLIVHCKVIVAVKDFNGQTSLHYASKQGQLDMVEYFIEEQQCNPACIDDVGETPLHSACQMGHLHIAKYLIENQKCNPACKKKSGQTPLHFACERGHLITAKYLIEEQHIDPSIGDILHCTPLHLACRNGHLHVTKYLIEEQQCDPACNDNQGRTPLHTACETGYLQVVKYLIEVQQCNPAYRNKDGQTPLHSACLMGSLPIAKYLVENKRCDTACRRNDGRTPLHFACQNGHLNVGKYLIEKQHINPSITDDFNQTPLYLACLKGHLDIVKYLTEEQHCSSICGDKDGKTPLHAACLMGHLNVAKYLIERQRCYSMCRKNDGQTPLHLACDRGHLNVAKYLIEVQQISPSIKDNANWTPLHSACLKGHLNVVNYLIEEHLCNPTCKSEDGSTPLHSACQMGHLHVIISLIESYECNATITKNDGKTPLHLACNKGNLNVVRYLIEERHIAPSTKDEHGETPLKLACFKGHLKVVKYLIDVQQCDPACSDNSGWTPLHYACQEGHLDVVRYLVEEQQCNPSCRDEDYQTPLHSACLRGHLHVVKYLIDICECDPICRWYDGKMPLHFVAERGHLDVAKYLIEECHIDPSIKDLSGWTPLHSACQNGHLEVTEFLLNMCHCDPTCTDSSDLSPLSIALNKNDMAIASLIMSNIYECGLQYGRTYLHLASIRGDFEVVKFLIENQSFPPQFNDSDGLTPLHLASTYGHIDIVRYLILAQNCNPICKGNDGSLPSSLAIANNHKNIALFLLQNEYGVHENNLLIHSACKAGHLINVQYLIKYFSPHVRDRDGFAPLHIACKNGYLEIVKFLVQTVKCNPLCITSEAWMPLHSACQCGNLDIVKYLIEEQQCDPNCRTLNGTTPLHLACRHQHFDIVVYLVNKCIGDMPPSVYGNSLMEETLKSGNDAILFFLMSHGLQLTSKYSGIDRTSLVQPALKVFVLGNAMSGKSTLIKALILKLAEGDRFNRFFKPKVTGVEPHTAGIIPYHAHSPRCGRLILYDFAGQYEHYSSSHAAILEKLRCAQSDLVFIVVDISRSKEQLVKELKYWDSFVSNQYGQVKPPVIVIGSHLDVAKQHGKQTLSLVLDEVPHLDTCVTLDCTRKSSSGLIEICKQISTYSEHHHKNFHIDAQIHFLNRLLREKFVDKIACQFCEVFDLIEHEDNAALRRNNLLPVTVDCLSPQLSKLSEYGQFLFIESEDIQQSWIIFKKDILLSELNGSIFAPEQFKNVYKDLSSTGVVALSKVKEAFPHYDHNMLMSFMTALDFCHEIDKSDLSIISRDEKILDQEYYFFFPALISTDKNTESCQAITRKSYKFGWCLYCKGNIFFTSRFLQVLLLQLAFTFALPAASSTNEGSPLAVEHRKCNIWKNGIHWQNKNGVETIVEVVEQNTAVTLVMGCLEGSEVRCINLRSAVIEIILSTKEKYSAAVDAEESLLHPDELVSYPLSEVKLLFTFPLSDLEVAIKERTEALINKIGHKQEMINIDSILYFEPYTCLTEEMIIKLINESDKGKKFEDTNDDFFRDCAKVAHPKMVLLKKILLLPEHDSEYNTAVKERIDQFSDDPTHKCFHIFKTWQKFTPNPTYRGLREALDNFSIFRGRHPLP